MGKRKLEAIDLIRCRNLRNITYINRKPTLIKKCKYKNNNHQNLGMELSGLIGADIILGIYREEFGEVLLYKSNPESTNWKVKNTGNIKEGRIH